MTVGRLCRRITEFGFALLASECALDARSHQVNRLSATRSSLAWVRDANPLMARSPARAKDYFLLLERNDYSYLMNDGGIIQISFIFNGNAIERHRLNFQPCPFQFHQQELAEFDGGLLDFLREAIDPYSAEQIILRSPLRFDYAPEAVSELHPASHLTFNEPYCRIPARSAMQFDTFIKFIFQNFYPEIWSNKDLVSALTFELEQECLSDFDKKRAYINWNHV